MTHMRCMKAQRILKKAYLRLHRQHLVVHLKCGLGKPNGDQCKLAWDDFDKRQRLLTKVRNVQHQEGFLF